MVVWSSASVPLGPIRQPVGGKEEGVDRPSAVVIDQWELVALGIATVLSEQDIDTVATVPDARTGVATARARGADVVVLGASAQDAPLDVARAVARLRPRPALVALVGATDHTSLGQLIATGVEALLLRSAGTDELVEAVRTVRRGDRYVSPALLSSLVGSVSPVAAPPKGTVLTSRERDVLACLAQGRSNREIADELFVGVETVKSHLSKLYEKLGARDRHDAVAQALAAGLLG
jgi:DNA-binding NarL/FixJ family response regulator